MKRFIILIVTIISMTFGFAQGTEPEWSSPSKDTEIIRQCFSMNIEGTNYKDVMVTLKSTSPDYFFTNKYKVNVLVKDKKGKKIYKKTFKNCYLYIYRNGQIQVGLPKFTQIIIAKVGNYWCGEIKEKEGIW